MDRNLEEYFREMFDPGMFIEDLCERETVDFSLDEFMGGDIEYHRAVTDMCHNGCAWMVMRAYKYQHYGMEVDLDNLFWCHGAVWGLDHSWVEYRDEGTVTVLDLTLSQTGHTADDLYIGPKMPCYSLHPTEACFADRETIMFFAEEACPCKTCH